MIPDKLLFARNVAARQPEMLEPQNQKLLENGYSNFLRIQKGQGGRNRPEMIVRPLHLSLSVWSETELRAVIHHSR